MKKNIVYMLFILCLVSCFSFREKQSVIKSSIHETTIVIKNRIDDLKTTQEVIEFAKSIHPKFSRDGYGTLLIKEKNIILKDLNNCSLFKEWDVENWKKIDLNNDGRTDLLFTSYWYTSYSQYAIIAKNKNDFDLFLLSSDISNNCKCIKPIIIDNKNELMVNNFKTDGENINNEKATYFLDTLTYKYDSFIERDTRKKVDYDIDSIKFIITNRFELELDNRGTAIYKSLKNIDMNDRFTNMYRGKSSKVIPIEKLNDLKGLLEYIRVKDLSNEYSINGYDFDEIYLKIKFHDGSFKEIKDYGFQGTFGLNSVYSKLIKIATETDWK